jgi:hypothetical protein
MNFTAQTPQPKQPKPAGRNYVSWIIFLLILARPLWGILRSLVPPGISSAQVLMIVAGVIALGVVAVIAARVRDGRPASSRLPTPSYAPPQATRPTMPRPAGGAMSRPPTFEPVITGTVVLVGFVVALVIGGGIALILLASA